MLNCPVCDDRRLEVFLRRSQVPVHQNLIVPRQTEAEATLRGELEMAVCHACGFVFNQAFDPAKLAYGEDYDNTQSHSAAFDAYLDGLVTDLVEEQGVKNCMIVEVGCGKGAFLRKLVAYPHAGNRGFGFDPSYVGPESDLDGRLRFRRTFYDETCADVRADVVVCRHVIEHVPRPLVLLRSVRAALREIRDAKVFFETPCVDWILRNQVFWDFFYEHCSLFSAGSLALAFERAGFDVRRVSRSFGDQYLWVEAVAGSDAAASPSGAKPGETPKLARAFGASEGALRKHWIARLSELRSKAKIAFWGAGAKGATLANLVDPERALVDCVVDINPNKQGRFIPGAGHPIIAPERLSERGIDLVVLMNPNYRAEVERLLAARRIKVDLIDGWTE